MGFHKRYISNESVIRIFNEGGVSAVISWYTVGCDAVITEQGLASYLMTVFNDTDWKLWDQIKLNDLLIHKIHKELGIEELKK
jgi:hypothetical protein